MPIADEFDFPWSYCRFIAMPAFAEIKSFFDREEQLLLAEEASRQAGHAVSDEWEAAYAIIEALNLCLVGNDGSVETKMLLHIYDGDTWFRL